MKLNDLTVLLVEDSKDVKRTIRSMLTEMGITQIFEASDGQQAMQYFDIDADGLDLIICDWNMPNMTGIEFLRQMRLAKPDLPFLMITARGDKDSVVAAKSANVTAYIRKPFSFNDLKTKIKSIFE